jgi:hypothetical protein
MKHYNWLSINSKIAKISGVKTYNFGVPAYKSNTGLKTCPNAASCISGCYAKAGAYTFSNVAAVFEKRLAFSLSKAFVPVMNAEIVRRNVKRIRVNDSGDMYSQEYLDKWIAVAKANPTVKFYAYSKMVTMIKNTPLPDNFTIVFSLGGTQDKLIQRDTDRHARVFPSLSALRKAKYANATENDAVAAAGKSNRIGLVYHGTKKIENTNWSKVLPK